MLRNYLKVVIRNAYKNRLHTLVNILGLTIGLACFILIGLYIYNEISYDAFWDSSKRIYRVEASWISAEGESRSATAAPPLASKLMQNVPEIQAATRIIKRPDFTLRPETDHSRIFREVNVYIADEAYFKVFSGRLLEGDPNTALKEPVPIVTNESAARRYFGDHIIGCGLPGSEDLIRKPCQRTKGRIKLKIITYVS